MQTAFGEFVAHRFKEYGSDNTHLALVKGNPANGVSTVRVHSFNPLKDLFAAKSGWNVQSALAEIAKSEQGVFVWIGDTGGFDLGEDLTAYLANTGEKPKSTYQTIGVGSQILRHLGVKDMKLLSSPMKFNALSGFDLNVVEYVSNH